MAERTEPPDGRDRTRHHHAAVVAVVGLIVLSAMLPAVAVWPRPGELALGLLLGVVRLHRPVPRGAGLSPCRRLAAGAVLLSAVDLGDGAGLAGVGAWPDRWTLVGAAIIVGSGLAMAGHERTR